MMMMGCVSFLVSLFEEMDETKRRMRSRSADEGGWKVRHGGEGGHESMALVDVARVENNLQMSGAALQCHTTPHTTQRGHDAPEIHESGVPRAGRT